MKPIRLWLEIWWPALLVMALIFLASSIPAERMPHAGQWDFSVKKGGHMSGYALLALGLVRGQVRRAGKIHWFLVLGLCGLYALSDEFHQSFVPGRNGTPIDVGIDLIGASAGLLVARIALQMKLLSPAR